MVNLSQQKEEGTKVLYYKVFTEYLLAIKMKKTLILINKPAYLILELSKILMDEFSYDYVKSKYCKNEDCVISIETLLLCT